MLIEIDHNTADAIFHMASVCFSESLGPDTTKFYNLMNTLKKNFSDVAERYCWIR